MLWLTNNKKRKLDGGAWKVNILIIFAAYQKRCNSITATSAATPLGQKRMGKWRCTSLGVCSQEVIPQDAALNKARRTVSTLLLWRLSCVVCCMRCPLLTPLGRPAVPRWQRRRAAHRLRLSLAPSKMSQQAPGVPTHTKEAGRKLFHIFCLEICLSGRAVLNYALITVNVTTFLWCVDLSKTIEESYITIVNYLTIVSLLLCLMSFLLKCFKPLEPRHLVTQVKHPAIFCDGFSWTQAIRDGGVLSQLSWVGRGSNHWSLLLRTERTTRLEKTLKQLQDSGWLITNYNPNYIFDKFNIALFEYNLMVFSSLLEEAIGNTMEFRK